MKVTNNLQELARIRAERELIESDIDTSNAELIELDKIEDSFWVLQKQLETQTLMFEKELMGLCRKITNSQETLRSLDQTNIYDDAFLIYYDGHFGTINGFRLGRLKSQPVEWEEINAAFGQVVLLVDTVAKVMDFQFSRYVLTPRGSFPRITVKDDKSQILEL